MANMSIVLDGLRLLGLPFFLQKLLKQIYSVTSYVVLASDLEGRPAYPETLDKAVYLKSASPQDITQFFDLMAKGNKTAIYDSLVRREFYKKGYNDCYIGRTMDSDEMCSIVWNITSKDVVRTKTQNYYPSLKEDEVIGENVYVLDNFKGRGIGKALSFQQRGLLKKRGFSRMIVYVREDNIVSLKVCASVGDLVCQKIVRRKLLFCTNSKIIDRFDPPIPVREALGKYIDQHK